MSTNPEIPDHLLVTGLPRTGSTLVAGALARHPEVAMLSEARQEAAALLIGKRYAGNKLYMPAQVDYKFSEDTTGLLSLRRRPSSRKRGYLYSYMQQRSKIIVTYRDALASIEALVRAMGVNADEAVRIWSRATEMTSKLVKHYRKRLYVCDYAELKANPEREFSKILGFLSLSEDESCTEFILDRGTGNGQSNSVSPEHLRLSELAPRAFAMYNGICAFRAGARIELEEHSSADLDDFGKSDFPDVDQTDGDDEDDTC